MAQLTVTADKLNKRRVVPSVLPDLTNINGLVFKNYTFEGILAATNGLGDWYKDRDENYYWSKGLEVLNNDTSITPAVPVLPAIDPATLDLPVNHGECLACAAWMKLHFEDKITAAIQGTSFEKELLYAIACQETAIYWNHWMNDHTPEEILARCVFDASGDANGSRDAFPKNTADFISRYNEDVANMLIAEANATRALRGWAPKQWVYAGYGIFQYDIQAITTDPAFFEQKQWYNIEACLEKLVQELSGKWTEHAGDLFLTVKAYNGAGTAAENYAKNVFQFLSWIKAGIN